jgi:hypothetical protein
MRSTHRLYRLEDLAGVLRRMSSSASMSGSPDRWARAIACLLRRISSALSLTFLCCYPLLPLPYLTPPLDDPVALTNPDLGSEAYPFWPHDWHLPLISHASPKILRRALGPQRCSLEDFL